MKNLMHKLGLDELSPSLDINNGMFNYILKPFPPADVPYFTESFNDFFIDVNWQPDAWVKALEDFFLKNKAYLLSPTETTDANDYVFQSMITAKRSLTKAALVGHVNIDNQSVILKLSIGKAAVYLVYENQNYKVWLMFSRIYQIWEQMSVFNTQSGEYLGHNLYLSTNIRFDQIRYHSHMLDEDRNNIALHDEFYRRSWIIGEASRRVREYVNRLKEHFDQYTVDCFVCMIGHPAFHEPPGKHLRYLSDGDNNAIVPLLLNIYKLSAALPLPGDMRKDTSLLPLTQLIEALTTPFNQLSK